MRDLQLECVNTHLPLRERARVALESQRRKFARAASLTAASPEQLRELNAALGICTDLQRERERYADHVAGLASAGPAHLNSLASLGNQIDDAIKRVDRATEAVYGAVAPDPVSEAEVEAVVQAYLAERSKS